MSESAAESTALSYATGGGGAHLSTRAWRILFWVAVIHLGALLALIAYSWLLGGFGHIVDFVRDLPRDHPYPIAFMINLCIGPMFVAANVLAVLGYRAGALRRSPRRWFVVYVPVQSALLLIQWGLAIYMVTAGPFVYTAPPPPLPPPTGNQVVMGGTTTLSMERAGLIFLPLVQAVITFPLVLLLAPKIRRGCLGH